MLAIGALFFDLDVGFSAFVLAVFLSAVHPAGAKGAINQIAWSTVLLVCGIVTYVSLMETLGTIDYLGDSVASDRRGARSARSPSATSAASSRPSLRRRASSAR